MSIDNSNKYLPISLRPIGEDVNLKLISSEVVTLPDSSVDTYLDLFHYQLQNAGLHLAYNFKNASQNELINKGMPPFFCSILLLSILTDGFLKSITFDHFFQHVDYQDSFVFSIDNYERSLKQCLSFLDGSMHDSHMRSLSQFFEDKEGRELIAEPINNFGYVLERSIPNLVNISAILEDCLNGGFIEQISVNIPSSINITDTRLMSDDISASVDCNAVSFLDLPLLTYRHALDCDHAFQGSFSLKSIKEHRNYCPVALGIKMANVLSIHFGNLYGSFATNNADKLIVTQVFERFNHDLNTTFETFLSDDSDVVVFSDIISSLEQSRKDFQKARALEIKKVRKAERELAKAKKREIEESRLQIERQRVAELKANSELENQKVQDLELAKQLELYAVESKERAKEQIEIQKELLLRKMNYVIQRKQDLLDKLTNLNAEILAASFQNNIKVFMWRRDLLKQFNSVKNEYLLMQDLESFADPRIVNVEISFTNDEFYEYVGIIDEDFSSLVDYAQDIISKF